MESGARRSRSNTTPSFESALLTSPFCQASIAARWSCSFSPEFLVFLLLTIDLGQQLQRARFLRPKLENVLQRFASMPVCMIVDMLPGQAIPVVDLAVAAAVFNSALQSQCGCVIRFDLQRLLQFLQGERIFFFFEARTCGVEQLRKSLAPHSAIESPAQRADGFIHVAFCFEFTKDFSGELKVAFFQGLGGALQTRTSTLGIEKLNRLVAQRFVEGVTEVASAG